MQTNVPLQHNSRDNKLTLLTFCIVCLLPAVLLEEVESGNRRGRRTKREGKRRRHMERDRSSEGDILSSELFLLRLELELTYGSSSCLTINTVQTIMDVIIPHTVY